MNYSELGRINLLLNNDGTQVFRQKRFENKDISLHVKYQDKKFPISNWSRTGISFQTESENLKIGDRVEDVEIYVNEHKVYSGVIEVKSKTENKSSVHYGASFLFKLFPIESVTALKYVDEFRNFETKNAQDFEQVNLKVCKTVLEMKHCLQNLKDMCEDFERKIKNLSFDERNIAESFFLEKMTEVAHRTLVKYNKEVSTQLHIDSLDYGSTYHKLFSENIYPFFELADISRRAKEKPLGYAGDFEMMNQIYRASFEGQGLFGKILHRYTATEMNSQAVLFRKPYFCNQYKRKLKENLGESIYVLSLASGPCVEFQELIKDLPQEELSKINLTLLDLDSKSLEHAQSKIYEQCLRYDKNVNIKFAHTSVKVFLEGTDTFKEDFDLIYSGGLFDYLDNYVSTGIITNLYKKLNKNGRMIIGNFTDEHSTEAFAHLIADWHLIHKSEEEMRAWAKNCESAKISCDYDDNHINAFLVIDKKA